MKALISRNKLRRIGRGAAVALALAVGSLALAAPAQAYWHHGCCWGGPHVGIGIDLFPPPPPVYYYPPPPAYYAPPPVVYAPPPPAPVVVQSAPTCTSGQWRQQDGSVVNGVACRQPDGTWRLSN